MSDKGDLFDGVGQSDQTNIQDDSYLGDLYEDVLTGNLPVFVKEEAPTSSGGFMEYKSYTVVHPKSSLQQEREAKMAAGAAEKPGKSVYVGNLTWWTKDTELAAAIESCGVTDLLSIKFCENRTNGQSKGFAIVDVSLDASVRLLMDHLPSMAIHGQAPMVTAVNKQNQNLFENMAKKVKPGVGAAGGDFKHISDASGLAAGVVGRNMGSSTPNRSRSTGNSRQGFPPGSLPEFQPVPFMGMPMMPQFMPHFMDPMIAAGMQGMMPPYHGMLPGSAPPIPGMGNTDKGAPKYNAHINPAFLQQDGYGMPQDVPGSSRMPDAGKGNDLEIFKKNQFVASSAIQKAMADANNGDYESGMQVLESAISTIHHSGMNNTEMSKVLLLSLHNCLQSLQAQVSKRSNITPRSGRDDRDDYDDYDDRRHRRRQRSRSRSRSASPVRNWGRERHRR